MFQIRYEILDLDDFVRRVVGERSVDIQERDRLIAERYPTIGEVWFAGEPYGSLWFGDADDAMQIHAFGASVTLLELKRGMVELSKGAASFETDDPGGGYGVALRLERDADTLRATRTRSSDLRPGPDVVETTWGEFVRAVGEFEDWYHDSYLLEASWLLRLEFVRQLRAERGMTIDDT